MRNHRERLGISITDLARAMLIDQGLLSKIERGLRPPPQIIPHVQRISERFGFALTSRENQELVDAAYRERFPGDREHVERLPAITLLESNKASPVRGLSGFPPELTHPDSPAGQYYRSKNSEGSLDRMPAEEPVPASVSIPPSPPWQAAMGAFLTSCGAEVLTLQQNNDQEKGYLRINGLLRFPNGDECEFKMSVLRRKKGKKNKG